MKPELTLYHYWRSSCSWRVRWALAIKGVSYKHVPVDLLHDAQHSPDFLAGNPSGFVPALKIGGETFGESLAILEWIEETYRHRPLLPQNLQERLRVRQLCLTIVSGTQPLQNLAVQRRHSSDPAAQAAWAREWIERGLASYEQILHLGRPGSYSMGSQISMADLCLVPQCYNAERFGVSLTRYPTIKRINDLCLQLPECQEAAPHNQPGAQLLASAVK